MFFLSLELNAGELTEAQHKIISQMKNSNSYSEEKIKKMESIFQSEKYMTQGNPKITKHPQSEESCQENLSKKNISYENHLFEKICGAKFMAPLFNARKEKIEDSKTCIDQFEFPNIPCTYPLVWVKAKEAAEICDAMGKRICDAHEWEGSCDGELLDADYDYSLQSEKKLSPERAIEAMRKTHNAQNKSNKKWAYGSREYQKGICGGNSTKSEGCNGGNYEHCGSNTYPSGSFPDCKSSLGVYDLHGNAAEHMNLPLSEDERANHPSKKYGYTEMKGSWFIFDKYQAHEDWCRWRAPFWHGTKLMSDGSHHNYHLGFRCCKDIKK